MAELLGWVHWWNSEHSMPGTPLQAWLDDPTPLSPVPAGDLRLMMLEDDGRVRKITTKGVSWQGRRYVGPWMTGQVGRAVRLRWMPHHEHEVEVFDARTQQHLGPATLADQASPEQIAELLRTRQQRRKQLAADLKAAEKSRRIRYAATKTATPPQQVSAITAAQAAAEQGDADDRQMFAEVRPRLMPLRPPAPGWALPRAAATPTEPGTAPSGGAVDDNSDGDAQR